MRRDILTVSTTCRLINIIGPNDVKRESGIMVVKKIEVAPES